MASFLSAGHHIKDSGAVGNGYKEKDLTIEFRDLVVEQCKKLGLHVITDEDHETVTQYFNRIKPGDGSVVIDFHFDAAENPEATGTTAIIGNNANSESKQFAQELVDTTSEVLGIRNRGVIPEKLSARKRLRIFREPAGIISLLEIAFITNKEDMKKYQVNKNYLACRIAYLIKKYDDIH